MDTDLFNQADKIWGRPISNQAQKQRAAEQMSKRLKNGDIVGVGGGSTSYLTLKALVTRRTNEDIDFTVIPASLVIELICKILRVPIVNLDNQKPDWCFDGADEVDPDGNMIKGRGGAMLREKGLIKTCHEVYIVIDKSKLVKKLGQNFPVPVEIKPSSYFEVKKTLENLDHVTNVNLRQAINQDGPIITETGNLILDTNFDLIEDDLESRLKSINGVVDSGLFIGYRPKVVISQNK